MKAKWPIASLENDDSIIELWRVRPNLLRLVQWFKDDQGDKEVIYIWQSQVDTLIGVLERARQGEALRKGFKIIQ